MGHMDVRLENSTSPTVGGGLPHSCAILTDGILPKMGHDGSVSPETPTGSNTLHRTRKYKHTKLSLYKFSNHNQIKES